VQIGVYASADNVRRLVQELQGKGFATEVAGIRSGGRDLQRVRVGPVADRAAALELQKRLAAAGREGPVVGP
jgi:cell division septation protein DedD